MWLGQLPNATSLHDIALWIDGAGAIDRITKTAYTATDVTAGVDVHGAQALVFNGTTSKIAIPSTIEIPTGSDARTFEFWFATDSFNTSLGDRFMSVALNTAGDAGEDFTICAEDQAVSISFDSHRVITPKTTLSTGTWYHVACVVPDGASGTEDVLIYINGVNQTLSNESGSNQTLNTDTEFGYIGASEGGGASFYDGQMANIRCWKIALSATQIGQIYNKFL